MPGPDLRLTIDTDLQLAAEQEVLAAYTADEAVSVSAIVMDPSTGAILAEASYPSYDANDYRTIAAEDPKAFIDPVVSSVYEPGSVFKMFTALAALEKGTIDLSTRILDSGSLSLDHGAGPDLRRRPARQRLHGGRATSWPSRGTSGRPGSPWGWPTRPPRRRSSWPRPGSGSGSGRRPASTWPARPPGLVRDPALKRWSQVDLANGSFGQGVAVTQLQLATAYAAMVNGGTLVDPPRRPRRRRPRRRAGRPGQVMSPATEQDAGRPDEPRRPHRPVVRARRRSSAGYDVGGKTGHRPDLGPEAERRPGRLEGRTATTTRSSATSAGARPSWSSR